MKKLPAESKYLVWNHKKLRLKALVLPLALPCLMVTIAQPAHALDRVLQVLGVCGSADAQYEGNRKHGRSHLTSFSSNGFAGTVIEGVEGVRVDALNALSMSFVPPETANTSTFVLRIKTKSGKVQEFAIGDDSSELPNIPTEIVQGDPKSLQVNIQGRDLVGGKSKLHSDDLIAKYSFLFSSNKKNSKTEQFIESVYYGPAPVSLILDPITCNLK